MRGRDKINTAHLSICVRVCALSHPLPSCLQTTVASSSPQSLLQMDPHVPPRYTSTLPSSLERPPCRRTEPEMERRLEKSRCKTVCNVQKNLFGEHLSLKCVWGGGAKTGTKSGEKKRHYASSKTHIDHRPCFHVFMCVSPHHTKK